MTVSEFIWPQDRVGHISKHGVEPGEVEEVCFGSSFVQRGKSEGKNPVFYVLVETQSGRHLFCVVIQVPDGKGYPVTAREMTASEKKQYKRWKK